MDSAFSLFRLIAFLLAASIPLLFTHNAEAGITDWVSGEGGRMRIVTLPLEKDGTMRGALQIEPATGWITYWREPGDGGIPPRLTFGQDARLVEIAYPVPRPLMTGQIRDIGYDHAVTLPFTIQVNAAPYRKSVEARVFVGLCRNICIPFQADFTLSLASPKVTPREEMEVLSSAMASLPGSPADDFSVKALRITGDRQHLTLEVRLPLGFQALSQVIVTGPEGHVIIREQPAGTQLADHEYRLELPVGKLPKGYDPSGKRWSVLLSAGHRSMEASVLVE